MENSTKISIAIIGGLVSMLLLGVLLFSASAPNLLITLDYPSIVHKENKFQIGFSLKNTVPNTLVQNTIVISSGSINQLDIIPTDCEELTKEERICEESLSFQVTNQTPIGVNKIIFTVTSVSKLNQLLLKDYITLSNSSSSFEIPINVDSSIEPRLTSQNTLTHILFSKWLFIIYSVIGGLIVCGVLLVALFIPKYVWDRLFN